jgi:hypothetical protein
MHFFFKVSANFPYFLFLWLSSLSFSLGACYFGFVLSFVSGYLTPSCECFLNYFKEGKKHFVV